ncbi:MAG: site-specific integrase [Methylacidiphilales bacterium]|nr:site-specific integrase [Candidatus Methylacidiphilales bacterium]
MTAEQFITYLKGKGAKPNTIAGYKGDIQHFLDFAAHHENFISDKDEYFRIVEDYINFLKQGHYAESSIARKIYSLIRYSEFIGYDEAKNILKPIRRPAVKAKRIKENDFEYLVEQLKKNDDFMSTAILLIILLINRLRIKASQVINIYDISENEQSYVVKIVENDQVYYYNINKPDELFEKSLAKYVAKKADVVGNHTQTFFVAKNGNPLSRQVIWRHMRNIADKVGIPLRITMFK